MQLSTAIVLEADIARCRRRVVKVLLLLQNKMCCKMCPTTFGLFLLLYGGAAVPFSSLLCHPDESLSSVIRAVNQSAHLMKASSFADKRLFLGNSSFTPLNLPPSLCASSFDQRTEKSTKSKCGPKRTHTKLTESQECTRTLLWTSARMSALAGTVNHRCTKRNHPAEVLFCNTVRSQTC